MLLMLNMLHIQTLDNFLISPIENVFGEDEVIIRTTIRYYIIAEPHGTRKHVYHKTSFLTSNNALIR